MTRLFTPSIEASHFARRAFASKSTSPLSLKRVTGAGFRPFQSIAIVFFLPLDKDRCRERSHLLGRSCPLRVGIVVGNVPDDTANYRRASSVNASPPPMRLGRMNMYSDQRAEDRQGRVTLHDVAAAAGVSKSTVSRILDERLPRSESETAKRVRQVAAELGYMRDVAAASLRRGKTLTIGVVVPRLTDTVMAMLYEALAHACARAGQFAIVATTDDEPEADRAAAQTLLQRGVDGLDPLHGPRRRRLSRGARGPRRALRAGAPDRRQEPVVGRRRPARRLSRDPPPARPRPPAHRPDRRPVLCLVEPRPGRGLPRGDGRGRRSSRSGAGSSARASRSTPASRRRRR